MRKISHYLFLMLVICSCSNDTSIKEALKQKALQESPGSTYKLIDYQTLPDVTYEQVYNDLYMIFNPVIPFVSKEKFIEMRQREFSEFHNLDKNYEYDVMHGDLMDASPWCTEIRVVTERADSLLNNWERLDEYDYTLAETILWYVSREAQYYQVISSDERHEILDTFHSMKDDYLLYGEAAKMTDRTIPCYHSYYHVYSLTDANGITHSKQDTVLIRIAE